MEFTTAIWLGSVVCQSIPVAAAKALIEVSKVTHRANSNSPAFRTGFSWAIRIHKGTVTPKDLSNVLGEVTQNWQSVSVPPKDSCYATLKFLHRTPSSPSLSSLSRSAQKFKPRVLVNCKSFFMSFSTHSCSKSLLNKFDIIQHKCVL